MFLQISTDFTPTPGIPLSSHTLQFASFKGSSHVERGDFTLDLTYRLRALNARTLRITAAAGTELAGASFAGTVNSLLISTVTVLPC